MVIVIYIKFQQPCNLELSKNELIYAYIFNMISIIRWKFNLKTINFVSHTKQLHFIKVNNLLSTKYRFHVTIRTIQNSETAGGCKLPKRKKRNSSARMMINTSRYFQAAYTSGLN